MGLNINTNMAAITSKNNLKKSSNKINKSIEKLSSGMKINRAADDASGLAISEKMKARIRALDTAIVNCEDGINLVSTIEGYIISVQDMVLRMSELTMKSANGILEDVDRKALQEEMDHLGAEIDRLADTANFNNIKVMTGVPSSTIVEKKPSSFNLFLRPDQDILLKDEKNSGKDTAEALRLCIERSHGGNLENLKGKAIYYNEDGKMFVGDDTLSETEIRTQLQDQTKSYQQLNISLYYRSSINEYPIILQIGETSQDVDKLNVKTYDFHTDVLFKPDYIAGTPTAVPNRPSTSTPPIFSIYGTEASSSTSGSGGTQGGTSSGVHYVYDYSLAGNFKENTEKSAYPYSYIFNISDQDSAIKNIDTIKKVSEEISSIRGYYGSLQNRLEHTINNLTTTEENLTAANSRIRDTDMAKELMTMTQFNVLSQAAQAMLAQANTQPQNILQLLQ